MREMPYSNIHLNVLNLNLHCSVFLIFPDLSLRLSRDYYKRLPMYSFNYLQHLNLL